MNYDPGPGPGISTMPIACAVEQSASGKNRWAAKRNRIKVSLRGSHLHRYLQSVSITDIHSPTYRR